jgi:hypothetical protein
VDTLFEMASTLLYMSIAAVLIASLFLIAIIQNSVDESRIIATPNIPREHGVLTSFVSVKIKASVEEVFDVLTKFKDYSTWTTFSEFKWIDVTADGVPMVGSTGSCKVREFEGYENPGHLLLEFFGHSLTREHDFS